MTADAIDITTLGPAGTLNIHGMDDEVKAKLGFLARYHAETLRGYELDLNQFKAWTMELGILTMLRCERHHLELYVRSLRERGLAAATIGRRFGTVRGYFRYAHTEGLILKDPAAYVTVPKVQHDQQHRTFFESVDMAIVLRVATEPRDRAVMQLLFDLALRVGELCSLDVGSLHYTKAGPLLRFIGKGNRLAEMVVHPSTMAALDDYLATRPDAGPTEPLILNQAGRRLTRWNVQLIIDHLSVAAGVEYRVTPHGLRRTSCRFGIQQGETLDDAAERLRHADSRVTRQSYAIETGVADIKRAKVAALMANLAR